MKKHESFEKHKPKKKHYFRKIIIISFLIACICLVVSFVSGLSVDGKRIDGGTAIIVSESNVMDRLKELAKDSKDYKKILSNKDKYPEKMLVAVCNNEELIPFVLGYPAADGKVTGGIKKKDIVDGIPMYLQWDKRWGYSTYGDGVLGLTGCAPTSLSMVITILTGETDMSPDKVAAYSMENGYYVNGTGTSWSLMSEGADGLGLISETLPLDEHRIKNTLKESQPIICSMGPGDFTTSGHFLVLVGVKDDKIVLRDPNSEKRSNCLWDYDVLEKQIKNLWTFSLK